MARILVVDDCPDQRTLVRACLGGEHELDLVESGEAALARFAESPPDLVLLDVGLPDCDGYRVLSLLNDGNSYSPVPVIFLTARSDPADKALAFGLGAEDFVVKPFEPVELRSRVKARLRSRVDRETTTFSFGPLSIDPQRMRATLTSEGKPVALELTSIEFRLLAQLARSPGRVYSRAQLIAEVWGEVAVSERTVDSHLSKLRIKLGPAGHRIESVRGAGYRFSEDGPP